MQSLVLLFLATTCALAIPSQREALNTAKREAQQAYTAAQRAKDKAQFIAAAERFQEVGQKVIAANQAALAAISPSAPADVKSTQAVQTWKKKIADIRRSLNSANENLGHFILPTELTPESVRSVDRHIREIDQAIEAHHAACLNIR
jgi:predicted  nucleic acid-binding Zn-ribbon protein